MKIASPQTTNPNQARFLQGRLSVNRLSGGNQTNYFIDRQQNNLVYSPCNSPPGNLDDPLS